MYRTIAALLVWSSTLPLVYSDHILPPNSGVLIANSGQTYGVAAYLTDTGASASSICDLASGDDRSCNAFKPAIKTAFGMVLTSISDGRNSTGIAIGDPNSPDSINENEKRDADLGTTMKDMLDQMDQEYDEMTISSGAVSRARSDVNQTAITVNGIKSGNHRYNISLAGSGAAGGHVTVKPDQRRKRTVPATSLVDPDKEPENIHQSDGAGFKVSFTTKMQNVLPGSLDGSSTVTELSEAMAQDWAIRTSEERNGSHYIAIFGQSSKVIATLVVIPEVRGYGIDQEDPNSFCGPLDAFACLINATCIFSTPHVSDDCSPLSRSPSSSETISSSTSALQPADVSAEATTEPGLAFESSSVVSDASSTTIGTASSNAAVASVSASASGSSVTGSSVTGNSAKSSLSSEC